jgi:hypothetical protein
MALAGPLGVAAAEAEVVPADAVESAEAFLVEAAVAQASLIAATTAEKEKEHLAAAGATLAKGATALKLLAEELMASTIIKSQDARAAAVAEAARAAVAAATEMALAGAIVAAAFAAGAAEAPSDNGMARLSAAVAAGIATFAELRSALREMLVAGILSAFRMSPACSLLQLPRDVLLNLSGWLELEDLMRLGAACRLIEDVSSSARR